MERALTTAQANPACLPGNFSLAEIEKDWTLWTMLLPVTTQFDQLDKLMQDTQVALGSDLYSASLQIYTYLKANGSTEGLDELKAAMSARFRQRPTAAGADSTAVAGV